MDSKEMLDDNWGKLATINRFDDETGSLICPSTKLIQDGNVVKRPAAVTTPVSLLVQSLVQQLCMLLENDHNKALNLYNTICDKLNQMELLDESYKKAEFEDMRFQYQRAFDQLIKVTCDNDLPLIFESWPVQLSRYYRDFEEMSFIAKGGFGKVFKAKNRLDGVQYAVKKIMIKSKDLDSISNHFSEVKTFASLSHPNIVPYKAAWLEPQYNNTVVTDLDDDYTVNTESNSFENHSKYLNRTETATDSQFEVYFEHDEEKKVEITVSKSEIQECKALCKIENKSFGSVNLQWATLYIQMALCDRTLKTWLDERNSTKFSLTDMKTEINIFYQVVRGVDYIHNCGIVHHDLKPTNIFMSNGYVQIADFGLACPKQHTHAATLGTLLYAAPEQIRGICDPKNDLYSIGLILLELIERLSTAMEKDITFKSIREGPFPDKIAAKHPIIAKIIQGLTEHDLNKRMDTGMLLDKMQVLCAGRSEEISSLQKQIEVKDNIIEEKDKEISRLAELLKNNNIQF